MASSGNFCTWNPTHAQGGGTPDLTRNGTLVDGNLNYNPGSYGIIIGSVGVRTGKWYWELRATGLNASGPVVGWMNQRHTSGGSGAPSPGYSSPSSASNAQFIMVYMLPGSGPAEIVAGAPSGSSSGTDTDKSGLSANDIIGVAGDFDNNKWYFSVNGSFTDFRSGQDPATGSNPLCSESSGGGLETFTRTTGLTWYPTYGNWSASGKASYTNFGQDSTFGGAISAGGNADSNGFGDFKYTPPTGFLAMCSANLPISDDIDPAQTDTAFPQKNFNPVLYTGNGSDGHAITGVGFQPDLVWLKKRSAAASHQLYDSNRGTGKLISSDDTAAEASYSTVLQSFDSDGFTLGTSAAINGSSATMVGWCWRANGGTTASNSDGSTTSTVQANQAAGFSIVTYTGTGSGTTIGHGLGAVPKWIIVRNRSSVKNWACYHIDDNNSGTRAILLNTGGVDNAASYWNSTQPTSSVFSIGGATEVNESSSNIVAYCWADVEGFQKFGKYEGNGNSDGPFVHLGFRPRLLVLKRTTSSGFFNVFDGTRKTFNSSTNPYLVWNNNDSEANGVPIDFLSNGFKVRSSGSGVNSSGNTMIYMAWGDVPFKYNNTF